MLFSPIMMVCPVLVRRRGRLGVGRGVVLALLVVLITFSSEQDCCDAFDATAISAMTTATATAFCQENSWKLRRIGGAISSSSSHLHAQPPPEPEQEPERPPPQLRPLLERPPRTETAFESLGPKSIPSTPKIVVLGATGKIGRHVVRQLLALNIELTVVAYVRDYQKALRIFYEDILVPVPSSSSGRGGTPQLHIVEGDLVSFDVATAGTKKTRHDVADDIPDEDEALWHASATSAAAFYPATTLDEYDNRDLFPDDVDEVLQEAIRDCTTIISCVGTVRPTQLWRDLLAPWPWPPAFLRLFHADVSGWCQDPTHPYYVREYYYFFLPINGLLNSSGARTRMYMEG